MLVSVIIPTYNRAHQLPDAIESVLALRPADFEVEIIVVDDGTQSEAGAVAERYPVRYLRNTGRGVSAARNTGIAAANGELLAFLDDDDVFTPDNLGPQVAYLREHPRYAAVFGRLLLGDQQLKPVDGPYPSEPLPSGDMFNTLLDFVPTSSVTVLRTTVARELGGFDTSLSGAEDWDFFLRIGSRYSIGYVHHVAAIARQHNASSSTPDVVLRRRFQDGMRVWYRHTKPLGMKRRAKLLRRSLEYRGWFVPFFIDYAGEYLARGETGAGLRALRYAMMASPPHTALGIARSFGRWMQSEAAIKRANKAP